MPACTVCSHAKSREINRALIRGGESNRALARRFGLTQASIDRHKRNHLRPYLSEAIDNDPELSSISPVAEVRAMFFRVRAMLDKAEDAQDLVAFKALHSEARRDLELLGKLLGEIREGVEVNNYVHPTREGHPSREEQFKELFAEIEEFRRENP